MPTAVQLSLPEDDARSVRILPDNVQLSSNLAESSELKSVNETVQVRGNAKTTSTSSSHDDLWKSSYNKLVEFKDREGHCRVPQNHEEGNIKLGVWVNNQRQKRRKLNEDGTSSMPASRVALLNKLGFDWGRGKGDDIWKRSYNKLVEFKNREGHCRVPNKHVEGVMNLGDWVNNQRRKRRKLNEDGTSSMTASRVALLDELGFDWGKGNDDIWTPSYNKLVEFKDREGHCRVPREHVEGDIKLGKWVNNQRQLLGKHRQRSDYKNHKSAQEKIDKLNKVSFVWDCYKGNSSKTNAISSSCSKELTSTKSSTSSAVAIGNNVDYTAMDDPNTNSKKSVRK